MQSKNQAADKQARVVGSRPAFHRKRTTVNQQVAVARVYGGFGLRTSKEKPSAVFYNRYSPLEQDALAPDGP